MTEKRKEDGSVMREKVHLTGQHQCAGGGWVGRMKERMSWPEWAEKHGLNWDKDAGQVEIVELSKAGQGQGQGQGVRVAAASTARLAEYPPVSAIATLEEFPILGNSECHHILNMMRGLGGNLPGIKLDERLVSAAHELDRAKEPEPTMALRFGICVNARYHADPKEEEDGGNRTSRPGMPSEESEEDGGNMTPRPGMPSEESEESEEDGGNMTPRPGMPSEESEEDGGNMTPRPGMPSEESEEELPEQKEGGMENLD
jgi:hypothetical protein